MAQQYILKRDVTPEECHWLDRTLKEGEMVYFYSGTTYGFTGSTGLPFTFKPGETPFFELPINAVRFYEQVEDDAVKIDMWLTIRDVE